MFRTSFITATKFSAFSSRPRLWAFLVGLILFPLLMTNGILTAQSTKMSQRSSDRLKRKPPRMSDYDRQLKVFVKNSKRADVEISSSAIYNLCQLHQIVVLDSRINTHDKMKSIRSAIARRLAAWERKNSPKSNHGSRPTKPSSNDSYQEYPEENMGDFSPLLGPVETELDLALVSAVTDSQSVLGDFTGGPSQMFAYAGGQFGAPWDHSSDLIQMIQATVDPTAWRSAGGNASIHYYQPSQALVIRASQKMHDDICELLFKLRAAF